MTSLAVFCRGPGHSVCVESGEKWAPVVLKASEVCHLSNANGTQSRPLLMAI